MYDTTVKREHAEQAFFRNYFLKQVESTSDRKSTPVHHAGMNCRAQAHFLSLRFAQGQNDQAGIRKNGHAIFSGRRLNSTEMYALAVNGTEPCGDPRCRCGNSQNVGPEKK
jgi:hypothetical protein